MLQCDWNKLRVPNSPKSFNFECNIVVNCVRYIVTISLDYKMWADKIIKFVFNAIMK